MEKDFKNWQKLKSEINNSEKLPTFNEREVWWCSIGVNVGHEADGKSRYFNRPVIVVRKFNKHLFLGAPLTTKIKNNPFYHKIHFKGVEQCVMITHLRLYDSKRLHDKMGDLPSAQFQSLRQSLANMILKKPTKKPQ